MISVKINLARLVWLAVALPGGSIVVCVMVSLWLHAKSSTATHCQVRNYLPSISAAVGSDTPEIYIWRICIGLHSFLRFGIAFVYYNFYKDGIVSSLSPSLYAAAVKLNCGLSTLENFSLVLLTDVSSTENYEIHKSGFIGFVLFSILYMLLTCVLFWKLGNLRYNSKNYHSFKRKLTFLSTAFLSLMLCAYFFWRHNKYCESGMYSLFALFEYGFVASNIAFHSTAAIDFQDSLMEIANNGLVYSAVRKTSWDV